MSQNKYTSLLNEFQKVMYLDPYLQTNKVILVSFIDEAFISKIQSAWETG